VVLGDATVYESIEDLVEAADSVVVGIPVGEVLRKTEEGSGLPMVYWEVEVAEDLLGTASTEPDDTLIVSLLDTDLVVGERFSEFRQGEEVLLFLDRIRADEGPKGVVPFDTIFVPLSSDNGVFDLADDGIVVARTADVVSVPRDGIEEANATLPEPDRTEDGQIEDVDTGFRFRASLEEVRRLITEQTG